MNKEGRVRGRKTEGMKLNEVKIKQDSEIQSNNSKTENKILIILQLT